MKFSHQLKFNAVPQWKDHYVEYQHLKRVIYQAEARATNGASLATSPSQRLSMDLQRTSSTGEGGGEDEDAFERLLDRSLDKVLDFYCKKEKELLQTVEHLARRITDAGAAASRPAGRRPPPDEESPAAPLLVDGMPSAPVASGAAPDLDELAQAADPWSRGSKCSQLEREKLTTELREVYIELSGLADYVGLNRDGFRKILKKHDKVLAGLAPRPLLPAIMPRVEDALDDKGRAGLEAARDRVVRLYAVVACGGNVAAAGQLLKRELREHLVFERTTVWQDMVEKERKTVAAHVAEQAGSAASFLRRHRGTLALLACISVFAALLSAPQGVPIFSDRPKQNCLALLAGAGLLWCSEALPLYVTSMLIPLLVVLLRVLVDPETGERLPAPEAAQHIFGTMFSQVIMLLIGGFAIAGALSKHNIAKRAATAVLARVGTRPSAVLLANMLVGTIASMWISNVAAPVLCFSLAQPVLRTLERDHPFAKALVLGIALACNLGGMTSPISSPQNVFAIEEMSRVPGGAPSWLAWFGAALPVALAGDLACWGLLRAAFRPGTKIHEVRRLPQVKEPWSWMQLYVVGLTAATVGLWCANSAIANITGEMGVVAIVPLVMFFGFGVLNKDDFNNFPWNVVMLAMGGTALGEAVKASGLLLAITQGIEGCVAGLGLFPVTAIFCALVLVATTFISHTVGAIVILPIVSSVGQHMADPHPRLLIMAAALMCSGAMGLPVSGFPNMTAVALEDARGVPYLTTGDFLRVGLPSSLAAYVCVVTLGFAILAYGLHW